MQPSESQSHTANDNSNNENNTQQANKDKQTQQEQAKPAQKAEIPKTNNAPQPEQKKKYNVIVGSFSSEENANNRVAELKSQGYSASIRFIESNKMYRVVVAGADESTRDKLKARYSDAWAE